MLNFLKNPIFFVFNQILDSLKHIIVAFMLNDETTKTHELVSEPDHGLRLVYVINGKCFDVRSHYALRLCSQRFL